MDETREHQMKEIYCCVDDYLAAHPALSGWRRSLHAAPRFTIISRSSIPHREPGVPSKT